MPHPMTNCVACNWPANWTPAVTCPSCMSPVHVVCAPAPPACLRCGTALPWLPNVQVPPPPPHALSCPRCGGPAEARLQAQVCAGCGLNFLLLAGALLDRAVQPPPVNWSGGQVKVRSAGALTHKMGSADPQGVVEGTLDPVTGHIPVDSSGILYRDIYTVALWRKVDVFRLVVAAILLLPLVLVFGVSAISAWGFAIPALFFGALFGLLVYLALFVKVHMMRVAGRQQLFNIRFDRPMWKRKAFHRQVLLRSGIQPGPIP